LKLIALRLLLVLFIHLLEQPLSIVDVELVLEPVAEHVILLEMHHGVEEHVLEGVACNSQALNFMQSLYLLLTANPSLVECLVLLLDALDFAFDLTGPLIVLF
jgi:hypothetical protein